MSPLSAAAIEALHDRYRLMEQLAERIKQLKAENANLRDEKQRSWYGKLQDHVAAIAWRAIATSRLKSLIELRNRMTGRRRWIDAVEQEMLSAGLGIDENLILGFMDHIRIVLPPDE